jgi:hypothetical protein
MQGRGAEVGGRRAEVGGRRSENGDGIIFRVTRHALRVMNFHTFAFIKTQPYDNNP